MVASAICYFNVKYFLVLWPLIPWPKNLSVHYICMTLKILLTRNQSSCYLLWLFFMSSIKWDSMMKKKCWSGLNLQRNWTDLLNLKNFVQRALMYVAFVFKGLFKIAINIDIITLNYYDIFMNHLNCMVHRLISLKRFDKEQFI